MAAAHHRTLDIPEVLENILVHLPARDLFIHQRVSKQFQAATKSPSCQKKMFLALSDTPHESWKLVEGPNELNPWYFECVRPCDGDDQLTITPVVLSPFLVRLTFYLSCAQRLTSPNSSEHLLLRSRKPRIVGSHSNLLATYISDTPCKEAVVSMLLTPAIKSRILAIIPEKITVRSETGLKLGDLWDGALDARGVVHRKDDVDDHGVSQVASLKEFLDEMDYLDLRVQNHRLELLDVVVPTAEEWASVRQREARK